MNADLHNAAQQYVGVLGGKIVCHTGIIYFPMQKGKKRVHRLVVLPEYQGIGIGTSFIRAVAEIVSSEGYELNLTTTTPATLSEHCGVTSGGRLRGTVGQRKTMITCSKDTVYNISTYQTRQATGE